MRFFFTTFGCRLNRAEALDIEAALAAEGHEIVTDPSEAEIFVVRGCSVTGRAQRDCEKEIEHLRAAFPSARIIVTGCLPNAITDNEALRPFSSRESAFSANQHTARAYLKVQDGCANRCAFCIVPSFRGAPVSVPFQEVMSRTEALVAAGFREIVVTGCNLALYRSEGKGLGALIDRLAQISARVRIGSLEPGVCDSQVIDAFEKNPNICRFLHLSVQSGSDKILRLMNRHYRAESVLELCRDARKRLGGRLNIGADIICGFPGETDDDFQMTVDLIKGCGITNLHAFPYSERPGTPAAAMKPVIPREVRHQRVRILKETASSIHSVFVRGFVGKEVEVCVENESDSSGWTSEYLPARIKGSTAARRSLARGRVIGIDNGSLVCDPIQS